MGLMDLLHGMANGPHGPAEPGRRGGISPITMGLLALLAYKTMRGEGPLGGLFRQGSAPALGNAPPAPTQTGAGGSLLDWLQSGLGGAVGGGAAGGIVSGGLTELLKRLEQNGLGDAGRSWVGTGPNQPVTPGGLEKAAGADTLDALARETGMPRDEVLRRLTDGATARRRQTHAAGPHSRGGRSIGLNCPPSTSSRRCASRGSVTEPKSVTVHEWGGSCGPIERPRFPRRRCWANGPAHFKRRIVRCGASAVTPELL